MKTNVKWQIAQKLEYKWWQIYLRKKDPNEYLEVKKKYWRKLLYMLSEYVQYDESSMILDAGCGPAGIFLVFQKNQVVALDPLLDKYKVLPHFQPECYPKTRFVNSSIELIDEKEKYEIIFCMNAINHVNNIDLCCKNLLKALKPGGSIIISTDAHKNNFLKKIFQLIPGDMLHPIQLNIKEYEALYAKNGMKLQKNILYKEGNIFDYYITVCQK